MLWYAHKKYTPEFYAAKLEGIRNHARCSTRCMALIAATAATVQVLVDVTYMFCL